MGLLLLVLLTILFAGGALFAKYKLEGLRSEVQSLVEARTGARFHVGGVQVNGLRGIRIDQVEASLDSQSGPVLRLNAPSVYININIADLLYGRITVDWLEADDAKIVVERPAERPWLPSDWLKDDAPNAGGLPSLVSAPAFRVVGKNCSLEILNLIGQSRLAVSDFRFDVSRLSGSPDVEARLLGQVAGSNAARVNLRYTSAEDFNLRVQGLSLTADDLATLLPSSQRFVESGAVTPTVRVDGYPGRTLVIGFETKFEQLALRNQPNFMGPLSGRMSGMANYDSAQHSLSLTTAKIDAEKLAGTVDGSVSFAENVPFFDLQLKVAKLPVADALAYFLQGRSEDFGQFDLALQEPCEILMSLRGTPDSPKMAFEGTAGGGELSFAAKTKDAPTGSLKLGAMSMSWASDSPQPKGSFTIVDGSVTHGAFGLKADHLSGILTLDSTQAIADPLNASISGNPFVGKLLYDRPGDRLEASASGTLTGLEDTALGKLPGIGISGAVTVKGSLIRVAKKWTVDGALDATQAELKHAWWVAKPKGIGLEATKVHLEAGATSLSFGGDIAAAGTSGALKATMTKRAAKWEMDSMDVAMAQVDAVTAGKCLHLPYVISGGAGKDLKLKWSRSSGAEGWKMTGSTQVDDLSLFREGNSAPIHCRGISADLLMAGGNPIKAKLKLVVKDGHMPPLREKWFADLDAFRKKDPNDNVQVDWDYDLSSETLDMPPWKGSNFAGAAYTSEVESGLHSFSASVEGGGRIEGMYKNANADHAFETSLHWEGVSALFLEDELQYPRVVTGPSTGNIKYSMDRDDPGTLKGEGKFEVHDGQFSADFVLSQLEKRLENRVSALPPSLRFSLLRTDIAFERDQVRTTNMQLVSQGLKMSGGGSFVTNGDMDYDLKVSFSPDMADKIPAIRDSFNVQGMKLAQQDIELAFKIKGPTFNPRGSVSEMPPVGVTLVSSAFQVGSEAMRVIDIPRKILTDLLRIGGGIVGVGK